ncbi:MAG: ABC transporter permease [Clostridiales Family XIII bacterium]|jgi:ribose/xylose/arabinose/galactoside ABC-type transport system permease subunit|nr:ABC transporter permease [Clostridiales Family XIII bacterium]
MKKEDLARSFKVWIPRIIAFGAIFIFMAIMEQSFFSTSNFIEIIRSVSVYGVMSCGMLFVVLIGGLDLSMGAMAGLCASIMFVIAQNGANSLSATLLGFVVALAVALAVGWLHGFFITTLKIPFFVVTLATKYILYGAIPLVTAGKYVYVRGGSPIDKIGTSRIFDTIPILVVYFVIIALVTWFILNKTVFGRRIYAIGGNPTAAGFVGIKVFKNTNIAYMLCTTAACIGGVILAANNQQAGTTTGNAYEGMVLMAMIVGGINLAGGQGTVSGVVFGALIIGLIQNLVTFMSWGDYLKLVQGAIILIVVIVSVVTHTRSMRGKGRKGRKLLAKVKAEAQDE